MGAIQSWRLENAILYFTVAAYLLALLFAWSEVIAKFALTARFANALLIIGFAGNTLALFLRLVNLDTRRIDHFKLVNGYAFLLLFTWLTVLLHLLLSRKYKFGACQLFVTPLVLGLTLYALAMGDVFLRSDISSLLTYRSEWLVGYILTSALAYSSFSISFGLGTAYLVKNYLHKTNPRGYLAQRLPALEVLDEVAYRLVNHGFPFFTASLIFGAIWAHLALGMFWSWQPKETWAFVTWLAYIAYLHARLLYGWSGTRSAWMTVMGFLSVLFTFIGVSYFLPGENFFNL